MFISMMNVAIAAHTPLNIVAWKGVWYLGCTYMNQLTIMLERERGKGRWEGGKRGEVERSGEGREGGVLWYETIST
jgi:hypothetical protein